MDKYIEYFFVGQDIQIQLDEKNPEWYDKYSKLKVEDIDRFLQDNNFVEDSTGIWRDTTDNSLYSFIQDDIDSLKRTGIGKMYRIS